MNPLYCENCARRANEISTPGQEIYNGVYHGRDYQEPCPVCRGKGRPVSIIHLAVECKEGEQAHPDMPGGKSPLGELKPHRIACGYGPGFPKHLTSVVKAATCYQCLTAYRKSISQPVESETQS